MTVNQKPTKYNFNKGHRLSNLNIRLEQPLLYWTNYCAKQIWEYIWNRFNNLCFFYYLKLSSSTLSMNWKRIKWCDTNWWKANNCKILNIMCYLLEKDNLETKIHRNSRVFFKLLIFKYFILKSKRLIDIICFFFSIC